MGKNHVIALAFAVQIVFPVTLQPAVAQTGNAAYPAMAPLDQYLMPDEQSEIALAAPRPPPFPMQPK
jgi:hypothetical protein